MDLRLRTLDEQIVELAVDQGRWAAPKDGPTLDLSDAWSIGGVVDAHAHLSTEPGTFDVADRDAIRRRAFVALESGIFLCLDKGWSDDTVLTLMSDPPDRCPAIQAAGRMIAAPDGYFDGFAREVDQDDLVEAVAEQASTTRSWVKLVGDFPRRGRGAVVNFDESALASAVKTAHSAGAKVAIHAMAGSASPAVRAGVDSIEHGLYLTESDVRTLAERGGSWVPTILRMEEVLRQMRPGSTGASVIGQGLENVRRLLPVAAEAGLAVLPGSDMSVPSAEVASEVERLVDYGMDRRNAVEWATEGGFRHCGLAAPFQHGEPADLVVLVDHPGVVARALATPQLVMRSGSVIVDRSSFDLTT